MTSATSETVRPIGPADESTVHGVTVGHDGTRPGDGRMPTTLQNDAGLRNEPPVSLPSAIGTMHVASATAAPPLDPPQVFDGSYGLRVAPNTRLNVCDPAPNSGVFVLPIVIAPAARMRSTTSESSVGTWSANNGEPIVVRMPAVSSRSLWATGKPMERADLGPGREPLVGVPTPSRSPSRARA